MSFKLEPAAIISQDLMRKIIAATNNIENEWFFFDGAFTSSNLEQNNCNTWLHENFVVVSEGKIIGYFEGTWNRPLDIISGFRMILFDKKHAHTFSLALFEYLDYLFVCRGCNVFNWTVALQNVAALVQYEKFIKYYCGRKIGMRKHAQKSYSGKISDINLYELTKEEYFAWKECRKQRRKL